MADGPDLDVGYIISGGRTAVATVSTRRFRVADSDGVEVAPDRAPVVILAVTVAIDMMAHASR
jgi:uncharacterized protein YxjI